MRFFLVFIWLGSYDIYTFIYSLLSLPIRVKRSKTKSVYNQVDHSNIWNQRFKQCKKAIEVWFFYLEFYRN